MIPRRYPARKYSSDVALQERNICTAKGRAVATAATRFRPPSPERKSASMGNGCDGGEFIVGWGRGGVAGVPMKRLEA